MNYFMVRWVTFSRQISEAGFEPTTFIRQIFVDQSQGASFHPLTLGSNPAHTIFIFKFNEYQSLSYRKAQNSLIVQLPSSVPWVRIPRTLSLSFTIFTLILYQSLIWRKEWQLKNKKSLKILTQVVSPYQSLICRKEWQLKKKKRPKNINTSVITFGTLDLLRKSGALQRPLLSS